MTYLSDPTRSRILIAGAGDVGVRLGLTLAAAGHEVMALRRAPAAIPHELTPIAADLCDAKRLAAVVPDGLTHVAYCAAADTRSDEAYARAYVQGLSNLLRLPQIMDAELQRFAFISSTAVYAQNDDSWVDESSPTEPASFSGRRTLEAEAQLVGSGLSHCVLRCGGIYGPGRTRLLDQVRAGIASYDPTRADYTNRIHVADVVGALAFLLLHSEPSGLVVGVDHEPARRRDVLEWLASSMGASPPSASTTRDSTRGAGSKRVSNRKLVSLGYQFRYPTFRDGYGRLLQEPQQPDSD